MATPVGDTTSSIAPPRISAPIQFTHQINTSLNNENFLIWKSQILPVLRGHGLVGLIDGSTIAPQSKISDVNGAQIDNPAFVVWQQHDQLLLAWLFSSISASVLAQVVTCATSAELWSKLNMMHSSQSMAKILDLKLKLQTAKKGGSSCLQFLQQMQAVADQLRSIGSEVTDQDLVVYTLQGLGSEFENFMTVISMRPVPPTMAELNGLLLAHEARLQSNLRSISNGEVHLTVGSTQQQGLNSAQSGPLQSQPNQYTTDSSIFYANNSPHYSRQQNATQGATRPPTRGRGRGRGGWRGRGRGRHNTGSQEGTPCQICDRWGHSALKCYHRFDIRYSTSAPNQQSQPSTQAQTAQN